MHNNPYCEQIISAWIVRLDDPDYQAEGFSEETLQAHLTQCEDCRILIEGMQADAQALNAWRDTPIAEPGIDFTRKVMFKLGLKSTPFGQESRPGGDLSDDELGWVAAAGEIPMPTVPGAPRKT